MSKSDAQEACQAEQARAEAALEATKPPSKKLDGNKNKSTFHPNRCKKAPPRDMWSASSAEYPHKTEIARGSWNSFSKAMRRFGEIPEHQGVPGHYAGGSSREWNLGAVYGHHWLRLRLRMWSDTTQGTRWVTGRGGLGEAPSFQIRQWNFHSTAPSPTSRRGVNKFFANPEVYACSQLQSK